MLPALQIISQNKRHFELYIGIFHFASKYLYNLTQAIEIDIFLDNGDWHFISDVLGLTYFLLLLIHLTSLENIDHNIILRYLAFTLAWIVKIKDQWVSQLNESILLFGFIGLMVYRYWFIKNPPKLDLMYLKWLGVSGLMALIGFIVLQTAQFDDQVRSGRVLKAFVTAFLNCCAGGAMYAGWKVVPCRRSKEDDLLYSEFV
jgi:hypothetical protein